MISVTTMLLVFVGISLAWAMTDPATGIAFAPKKNGLEIFGVGVRKKGPIKVYSVAMYCTSALKDTLTSISRSDSKSEALQALCSGAKDEEECTFLLQMAFKVGGEKMASAISDSVAPRHTGSSADIESLRKLVSQGIPTDTGASKGTTLQFDCSKSGVAVAVNGKSQGKVESDTLGSAFCDVYLDDSCVSPPLRENCLANCCAP